MPHIELARTVSIHQALADPLRIRIMRLLLERELCVCEIMRALEEPQYKISRHLAVLKNAGLVCDRREGLWMHYEIAPAQRVEGGTPLRRQRGRCGTRAWRCRQHSGGCTSALPVPRAPPPPPSNMRLIA